MDPQGKKDWDLWWLLYSGTFELKGKYLKDEMNPKRV